VTHVGYLYIESNTGA